MHNGVHSGPPSGSGPYGSGPYGSGPYGSGPVGGGRTGARFGGAGGQAAPSCDMVTVPERQGLETVDILRLRGGCGPVLHEDADATLSFLVPVGAADAWHLPGLVLPAAPAAPADRGVLVLGGVLPGAAPGALLLACHIPSMPVRWAEELVRLRPSRWRRGCGRPRRGPRGAARGR